MPGGDSETCTATWRQDNTKGEGGVKRGSSPLTVPLHGRCSAGG